MLHSLKFAPGLFVFASIVCGCATRPVDSVSSSNDRPSPSIVTHTAPTTAPSTQPSHESAPLVLASNTVVTRGIRYAKGATNAELQSLDVYAPREAKGLPSVIFVHGGGWTRGDRGEVGSQPAMFNSAGVILISVDYRLAPAAVHPALADDIASAVAWTHANIRKFGGDPNQIFVMGHSAGSHLAALVATDPRYLVKHGLKLSAIRGAISLDGSAFDIVERIEKGGEKLAENCRRAFGADPAVQADASPMNHVKGENGVPPFLLIYAKEGTLDHAQSKRFSEKLDQINVRAGLVRVDGKTHASLLSDLGTTNNDQSGPAVLSFIKSLAPSSPAARGM